MSRAVVAAFEPGPVPGRHREGQCPRPEASTPGRDFMDTRGHWQRPRPPVAQDADTLVIDEDLDRRVGDAVPTDEAGPTGGLDHEGGVTVRFAFHGRSSAGSDPASHPRPPGLSAGR